MDTDTVYQDVRTRCASLADDAVLETPTTNRILTVESADGDGVTVRTPGSEEARTLERDRFEQLAEEVADGGTALSNVPPGAEPYVAVLSLLPRVAVEDDRVVWDERAEHPGSSLLSSGWEERPAPARLHDDATLLADLLDRTDIDAAPVESLVDLYVLLSDVQYESGDLREDVRDDLLASMGPEKRRRGRFGTVTRTERERRRLKDEETVLRELDDHDIPREWALGVDRQKLDVVVAVTDLDEEAVYDVETETYVQKTDVSELEKEAYLQGFVDQLGPLEGERAERLHEDVEELEERLDELLQRG